MIISNKKPESRVILAMRRKRIALPPPSRILSGVSIKLVFQECATNLWINYEQQRALNQDDVLFIECFNSMLGINPLLENQDDSPEDTPEDTRLRDYGLLILAVDDETRNDFIDYMVINYETLRSIAALGDSVGSLIGDVLIWLRTRAREIVNKTADAMEADDMVHFIAR